MKCTKCGKEVDENTLVCSFCNNPLDNSFDETKESAEEKLKKAKEKESEYLGLFFAGIVLSCIIPHGNIFLIISILSIVIGHFKCPNSVLIEVLFILTIIIAFFWFFLIGGLMATCSGASSCFGLGVLG